MPGKRLTFRKPSRMDYYLLVFVALYASYSYWSKDIITNATGAGFSVIMHVVLLIFPLLVFGSVLLILSRQQWSEGKLGLELGRRAYANFVISFILAAAIIITLEAPETSAYSFGQLVLITMNIVAGEIVLRAAVMEMMLKMFGKTAVGINLAFILSVVLYAAVQIPGGASISLPISWGIGGSLIYYGTGSVLALVLLDSLIFLPELDVGGHRLLAVMVVVLYFALAVPATFICRSRTNDTLRIAP